MITSDGKSASFIGGVFVECKAKKMATALIVYLAVGLSAIND
jgi:hypothetical protein